VRRSIRVSVGTEVSVVIAVIGAGAMGAALGISVAAANPETVLLATEWDAAVVEAWRKGAGHPALGLSHPLLPCRPFGEWDDDLGRADMVIIAVSTEGLASVLAAAIPRVRDDALWVIATKGWRADTLESPSQAVGGLLGSDSRVVSLGGPGLAPELAVGAPTVLVCAGTDSAATARVGQVLRGRGLSTVLTDDVVGVETCSAYKNVVAVAVGICEGFSDRLIERASVHSFANARAAVFALGLLDMVRLAERLGGRAETVLGLAGSGDLYVTSLGGRNGRFGRLLGAGQTPEHARKMIGSTVEGIANCASALALASKVSIELPTARAVELALAERLLATRVRDQPARQGQQVKGLAGRPVSVR
jgi:glycerol-3-phosphate dehydrogenase (NAD(P)+)